MTTNQPPSRPWLRLGSMARPVPAATPTPAPVPEPTPAQQRPIPARLTSFRPLLPSQPQPPPQSAVTSPPPPAAPSTPEKVSPVTISPVRKTSPTPTMLPVTTTTTTTTSSPKPKTAPSSSMPTSPAVKSTVPTATTTTTAVSMPISPAPKPAVSISTTISPPPKATSVPSSPSYNKPVAPATTTHRGPSPTQSPRTIKPVAQTPPQSPKSKPTAPLPSPLILPPSQLKLEREHEPKIPVEAEQKTVLIQKTVDNSKPSWLNGTDQTHKDLGGATNYKKQPTNGNHAKHQAPKDVNKEKGHRKKISSDSEESGTRVITLAGENKGAFMEVIHSPKKHPFDGNPNHLHKTGNSKTIGSDGSEKGHSYGSSSGEEAENHKMNMKEKINHKAPKAMPNLPMSAFMNSNVQGVNNSIVYDSSCSHHDPGVHLVLSRKQAGD